MSRLDPREARESLSFIFPLLLFVSVLIVIPILGTSFTSLFQDISFLENKFIGLKNYFLLFQDPGFWQATRFTFLFLLISVPLEIILGLIFALVLNEQMPGRAILRVCVLIPWAIPVAVSARTWELIYNFNYGLANFLFAKFGLSQEPIHWLGTTKSAFLSLVMADAWKTSPFVAIILLAGLQAIPHDLYAQAKIDRAGMFQRFTKITLPLLKPVLLVALLFRTIDVLRIFDLIYVLTRGGPGGATNSLSLYGYQYFLTSDFGYGSAVSVVLFLMALALSIMYVKLGRFGDQIT